MTDFEKAVLRVASALRVQLLIEDLELHGEVSGVWHATGRPETGIGWKATIGNGLPSGWKSEGNPPEPVPAPDNRTGEWAKEPPTGPGWYWWRDVPCGIAARVVKVIEDDGHRLEVKCGNYFEPVASIRGEWWSVPIQAPATVSVAEGA